MSIPCSACRAQISDGAAYCAKCGTAVTASSLHIATPHRSVGSAPIAQPAPVSVDRYVSIPLTIGIVLMPIVFVWFLLRQGYSQRAKAIGFGWAAIWLIFYFVHPGANVGSSVAPSVSADTSKPHVAPPAGIDPLAWGDKPGSDLKLYMHETDAGISMYVPKAKPKDFAGVPVSEQDLFFKQGKLAYGDYYFHGGEQTRDALLKKLTDQYGEPQAHNDLVHTWTWDWGDPKITVRLYYNEDHQQSTVTYSHD